jgi:hypothetical protein
MMHVVYILSFILMMGNYSISFGAGAASLQSSQKLNASNKSLKSKIVGNKEDGDVLNEFAKIIKENKNKKANEDTLNQAYAKIRATILDDVFQNVSASEKAWYLAQLSENKEIGWGVFNDIVVQKTRNMIFSKIGNILKPTDLKKKFESTFMPTLEAAIPPSSSKSASKLPIEVIDYIVGLKRASGGIRKTELPLDSIPDLTVSKWDDPKQLKGAYRYYLKLALGALQNTLWEFDGLTDGFLQSREKLFDDNKRLKADALRIRTVNAENSVNTQGLWLVDINKKYLKEDAGSASEPGWQLKYVVKQLKNSKEAPAKKEQAGLRIISDASSPVRNMPPKSLIGRGKEPVTYLPKISFDEMMLKIAQGSNKGAYVVVLKAAKGKALIEYSALKDPNQTDVKPFEDYGEALSNFHQYFNIANTLGIARPEFEDITYTINHGDGHPYNVYIFYAAAGEKAVITFIDNATMVLSLLKEPLLEKGYLFQAQPYGIERHGLWRVSILDDITKFVYPLVIIYDPNRIYDPTKPDSKASEDDPIHKQVAAFLVSYIKAYPKEQQKDIWSLIEKEFDSKIPVQEHQVLGKPSDVMTHCGKTEDNIIKYCKDYLGVIKSLVNKGLAQ